MITTINRIAETILVTVFVIMTVSVIWQVMSRYLFNISASWTEELSRYCLMWLAMLGAAYITGKREHIEIDVLFEKFSLKNQQRLEYFIEILIIIFAVTVMVIGGGYLMYMTFYLEQKSPALQVPLGYIYSILPLSGLLIVMYTLHYISQIKSQKITADEP